MLLLGLTGGIAAGKSTVAGRLAGLGGRVIDADLLARAAVAPGTPGLAAVAESFGPGVLTPGGELNRPALGAIVFADKARLGVLNSIVHPAVAALFRERVAEMPPDAVVVHDVPLLVENDLAPNYHLVLVVGASERERIRRMVADRGMSETDAAARISAQASDADRRAVADIWLENEDADDRALRDLDRVWAERILPYEENIRAGRRAERPGPAIIVDYDPSWPAQAGRLLRRLGRAARGASASPARLTLDHVGSTSVPGLAAKDVLDLQIGVDSLDDADRMAPALAAAGFPAVPGEWWDTPKDDPGATRWPKRYHASADPGRAVNLHVRVIGSPGWRYALAFRDWLRADDAGRDRYAELKRSLAAAHAGDTSTGGYADAKEPWFTDVAHPALTAWVARTGWTPPTT